ncbi:MAG: hypothetical protein J3Q66DRAFT_390981 [Benniella sp.]|nr:MAG: hypothetical protein J3Q66DRAFT_390981 [Benniella sp.]
MHTSCDRLMLNLRRLAIPVKDVETWRRGHCYRVNSSMNRAGIGMSVVDDGAQFRDGNQFGYCSAIYLTSLIFVPMFNTFTSFTPLSPEILSSSLSSDISR